MNISDILNKELISQEDKEIIRLYQSNTCEALRYYMRINSCSLEEASNHIDTLEAYTAIPTFITKLQYMEYLNRGDTENFLQYFKDKDYSDENILRIVMNLKLQVYIAEK